MDLAQVKARIAVLERSEALKDTERSGFTTKGRREDVASHTWRLCLWIMMFEDQFTGLDVGKMLRIAVVHDLGEAVSGDIPAPEQTGDKGPEERADFATVLEGAQGGFIDLWDDYDQGLSEEARVVKGLDKLETILQHTQGKNPENFDYGFNLSYGAAQMQAHPLLEMLRDVVDQKTRKRMG